ncbi:MAG: hypothetical protein JWN44_5876 [Myxococcales bacterium]|nr:hypothetical protein [Myxococcales bacterium]
MAVRNRCAATVAAAPVVAATVVTGATDRRGCGGYCGLSTAPMSAAEPAGSGREAP